MQTFPSDYRFCGSHESMERQIGNAVPVRLAHALGLTVRRMLGLAEGQLDHEYSVGYAQAGWHQGWLAVTNRHSTVADDT